MASFTRRIATIEDLDALRELMRRSIERLQAGFRKAKMIATMAGVPLYEACGYVQVEPVMSAPVDGIRVPLVRMEKVLA